MTDQDKFKLIADAFHQNFVSWNPSNMLIQFGCKRTPHECRSCILNSSNYRELEFGRCLGSNLLNDASIAAKFFDQYPEFSI